MKRIKTGILPALCLGLLLSIPAFGAKQETVSKTFPMKKNIRLKLALGNCTIEKSSDNQIHVRLNYDYEKGTFEPVFKETDNALVLEEKFSGQNHHGSSDWTVAVPGEADIEISSGTGDITIKDVAAEIEANSGTGDIELTSTKGKYDLNSGTGRVTAENAEGKFKLNSGTGKVIVRNCSGDFDANSGTGTVEASRIKLDNEGKFNSGTGEVEVDAPQGKEFDLHISSGTNDAILDMKGEPLQGYFEFTAHARIGQIVSPEKFDNEGEYSENSSDYLKKSFTRGKDTPRYYISTGTGKAILKK
ncbi:MAG: DUF4097 family beta strand repeat-containing protein [Calditrichia bacterium]